MIKICRLQIGISPYNYIYEIDFENPNCVISLCVMFVHLIRISLVSDSTEFVKEFTNSDKFS